MDFWGAGSSFLRKRPGGACVFDPEEEKRLPRGAAGPDDVEDGSALLVVEPGRLRPKLGGAVAEEAGSEEFNMSRSEEEFPADGDWEFFPMYSR
ncbi:hypothetical protein [Singulisphaera acidiphila]|uniref:hypothetical protein n=1 Tax=Singulisphaera acidiphila TaxID=466153 RepID=UPI00030A4571|nr:hypothetical protein [Singulisphaera acidiphila]